MPELPEVETVRRSLEPMILGRRIRSVTVRRPDVVAAHAPAPRALGSGDEFTATDRRGKQLALRLASGGVVLVHLGMSGQLFVVPPGRRSSRPDHNHVVWRLDSGAAMVFRDPRRFGGVWTFPDLTTLHETRWLDLGPDAITVKAPELRRALAGSRRAVKACLLDQRILAGVGNIYADEALFIARIHPETPASALPRARVTRLAEAVRQALREGVAARGSTLRDFVDAEMRPGDRQSRFRVYARAGLPCPRCAAPLSAARVSQRSTTFCPRCQPAL